LEKIIINSITMFIIKSKAGKLLLIVCFSLITLKLFPQSKSEILIQEILKEIIENIGTEYDLSEVYDKLIYYYHEPICINEVDYNQLSELFFLSDIQINAILDYQKRYKGFNSIYELRNIQALDDQTIEFLSYFISFNKNQVKKRNIDYFLPVYGNDIQFKVERTFSYEEGSLQDTSFLGSMYKMFIRYIHQPDNKLSYGVTMEKDAGEEFFKGSQKYGFDFYSAHLCYQPDHKIIKTIALGDFNASFGQGLVLSTGFSMGKTSFIEQIFKSRNSFYPFRSVNENEFLRGVGISISINNIKISGFYSNKNVDASIFDSDTLTFASLYESGYHRTIQEISKKDSLNEQVFGFNTRIGFNKLDIGISFLHGIYNNFIYGNSHLYNMFNRNIKNFTNAGIDYSFVMKKFHFFGELASNLDNLAYLSGIQSVLTPSFRITFLYRNYPANYFAPYSGAFAENSMPANENGLFTGFNWNFLKKWTLSTFYDHCNFPWLKYLINKPSVCDELLVNLTNKYSYKFEQNFRFKYKFSERNYSNSVFPMGEIIDWEKYQFRYYCKLMITKYFEISSKVEISISKRPDKAIQDGILSQLDIRYRWLNNVLVFRYALFSISDYDASIYSYEDGVPGSFNSMAYFGEGFRLYMLSELNISKKITCFIKVARTTYFNSISLPGAVTTFDNRNEIKLMINYDF